VFTVCIPSFNHRHFLVECTLSALRSPLVTEVLLVDDGSSDRSPELFPLLQSFSPRVRILPTPFGESPGENLGAHARINQLVTAAANEWVAVLNSDDQFVAGRFEAVARIAQRHSADLLFGDLVLIDGEGRRLGERNALRHNEVAWPATWDLNKMAQEGAWVPILCLQNIMATTTNMVFTKTLHAQIGGFRDLRYCHDWDFALRAALAARVQYVPAMMALYRLHQGNTIKEASDRVQREVRRMLAGVVQDVAPLRDDPALRRVLAANHYLAPDGPPVLAVVMTDPVASGLLCQAVTAARLPVMIADRLGDVTPDIPYLYQPGPDGAAALRLQDLRSILLAVAAEAPNAVLLDRHAGRPGGPPGVDEAGLADALVVRRGAAGRWRQGARTVRLYPATLPALTGPALDVPAPSHGGSAARVPMPAPVLDPDTRPVIFILPAFLAVGGVEGLVLQTMRHLAHAWRFVVVTTEPLRPEQGSTHAEAMALAPVYDLAELTGPESRLRALELLRDWHGPALVWIVNGAPWQVDHAADIRRVFASIPIVDHQAYDHEAGWITRFGDAGVRAADRFVAINQKIRHTMQDKYQIPAGQIDLVYHGADTSRMRRRDIDAPGIAAHRMRFGLDPSLPLFGMIGRLTAQKKPLDLVSLAKKNPKVQFAWVGLGELEGAMQGAIERVPNMRLIPSQSDLRPIYEMLDGLVVTSGFEGLPLVVLEALSMGLPVLSSDVGAIKDRYGSGMVFDPPGDLAALAAAFKAFRRLLPEYRAVAARQAAQVAEDFSSERMVREYDASFRAALAGFAN